MQPANSAGILKFNEGKNMIEYITKAIDNINHNSTNWINGNKWFRRNVIINMATSLYMKDNPRFIYEYVYEDIVKDELRASHHGVRIGASLGIKGTLPRKDRYIQEARIKRQIKRLLSED